MTMKWIRGEDTAAEEWGELGYVEFDDGRRRGVVEEGDTESPLHPPSHGRKKKKTFWYSIRTLLLENNELVYGCADCWYAAESPRSVLPHRNAHRPPKNVEPEERIADAVTNNAMTVEDFEPTTWDDDDYPADELTDAMHALELVLDRAKLVDELIDERDTYKQRAEEAEARVKRLEAGVKALMRP